MKPIITARNFKLTRGIEVALEDKLSTIKPIVDANVPIKVVMETKRYGQKIEISISIKNKVIRAEAIEESLYTAINTAVEHLKTQIQKLSTPRKPRPVHMPVKLEGVQEDKPIVKRKSFEMKPMSEDEAILQMELLGHSFFMFFNADTEEMCLLYKRRENNYGLIEASY